MCLQLLKEMVIFQVNMKVGEDYDILQICDTVFIQNGGQQLSIAWENDLTCFYLIMNEPGGGMKARSLYYFYLLITVNS